MSNNSAAIKEAIQMADYIFGKYSESFKNPLKFRSDLLLANIIISEKIVINSHYFPGDLCGILIIDEYETTLVYNTNQSQVRRYFTMGHELGHYFLHRHMESQFTDRAKDLLDNSIRMFEIQANAFSAQLILPRDILISLLDHGYHFHKISRVVMISYEALTWRLVSHLKGTYGATVKEALLIVKDYKDFSIASMKNLIHHSYSLIFSIDKNNFREVIKKRMHGHEKFEFLRNSSGEIIDIVEKKISHSSNNILERLVKFHYSAIRTD